MKTTIRFMSYTVALLGIYLTGCSGNTVKTDQPKSQPEDTANVQTNSVARIMRFEVTGNNLELFSAALMNYTAEAMLQNGNVMAEAYYEQDKPTTLWLIERWTSNAELKNFKEVQVSVRIDSLSAQSLKQPGDVYFIKDLEPLTKEEWRRAPQRSDKPLTIMLFVDSQPGTEQKFLDVYHTAMPLFQSEPGVINYQLSQLEDDKTQFVTYEKFRDAEAFQYHLNFPPIKPVLEYLNTSIKEQPFQKGLHRLIPISYQ